MKDKNGFLKLIEQIDKNGKIKVFFAKLAKLFDTNGKKIVAGAVALAVVGGTIGLIAAGGKDNSDSKNEPNGKIEITVDDIGFDAGRNALYFSIKTKDGKAVADAGGIKVEAREQTSDVLALTLDVSSADYDDGNGRYEAELTAGFGNGAY
ncbi:MAG: hypothetical protein LBP62_04155 [Clostridiales bacterium]|jgi:hypothetical protein|nr:hypothetical protein [Clostridiales bacterium]